MQTSRTAERPIPLPFTRHQVLTKSRSRRLRLLLRRANMRIVYLGSKLQTRDGL
jgi:hypothetical protein